MGSGNPGQVPKIVTVCFSKIMTTLSEVSAVSLLYKFSVTEHSKSYQVTESYLIN